MSQIHRHFGAVRGEEVVVAGYNKSTNACMIVRINHLPQDEAAELRRIAMSATAQNLDYLVPTLRVERHKSNQDWFTHLVTRMYRNDGSVLSFPLKDIEAMNEGQKAFFKGYGTAIEPTGGPSQRVGADTEFSSVLPTADANPEDVVVAAEVVQPPRIPANLAEAQGLSPTPATDPEMARAAAQAAGAPDASVATALTALAESQAAMAASLEKLVGRVKAPTRRKTKTKRKASAKKSA
jgi:hypothetical protein